MEETGAGVVDSAAVQLSVAVRSPKVVTNPEIRAGAASGVEVCVSERSPSPAVPYAETLKEYSVPFVRPSTVKVVFDVALTSSQISETVLYLYIR